MKLQAEKYNVAWFRLAECVSRREKERALGVYRLLSHSFDEKALAAQLYADLLLCFEDQQGAIESYKEAAQLYQKAEKMIESAAIYEHLVFLSPDEKEYLFALLEVYKSLGLTFKMVEHAKALLDENKIDLGIELSEMLNGHIKPADTAHLQKDIVFALLKTKGVSEDKVMNQIQYTVDSIVSVDEGLLLQEFLSELKAVNSRYYTKVCAYLEKK